MFRESWQFGTYKEYNSILSNNHSLFGTVVVGLSSDYVNVLNARSSCNCKLVQRMET